MTQERAELRTAGGASAHEFLATVRCKDTCGGYSLEKLACLLTAGWLTADSWLTAHWLMAAGGIVTCWLLAGSLLLGIKWLAGGADC